MTSDTPDALPPVPESKPRLTRAQRREKAAGDALRSYIRDLHEDRFAAQLPRSREVELVLRLKTRPAEDWALEFDPPLPEQVLAQIEDVQAKPEMYRAGHVHCFRCDSSDCEHSLPPTPPSVFRGYEPNGAPDWGELVQELIAAKDERVDRLFDPAAGVVALVRLGHDLRVRQLSSFGRASKTYSVLGQVAAGYFAVPGHAERLAVTFQAVETRGEGGAVRLRFNALARLPDQGDLAELLASGWEPGLYRAREAAAAQIERVEQQVNAARAQGATEEARRIMGRIPGILRHFAESIERARRQETRRTHHVEVRRHQQRPVHKALEDALACPPEFLFYDEKARTTVAVGRHGRAHAFSANGKHVTSFVVRPPAVEFRLRTSRWRRLTAGETEEFRRVVRQSIPG